MARHLVEARHDVTVTSRSRGPIDKAVASGAIDGGTHDAVVRASEVTIVCVPGSSDVVDVLDAAMPALGEGKIVVDASTIDPDIERAQHERVTATGAWYLEAPLSGGTVGAEQGTLTLMVGGDADVLAAARPRSSRSRNDRPRRRAGQRPDRQAVQQPPLRRADAGDRRGDDHGGEGRCRPAQAARGHHTLDRRLQRDSHPHPIRGCAAGRSGVERLATGLHDRPHGQGPRHRDRVRGSRGHALFTSGIVRQLLSAASTAGYGREDFSSLGKIVRELGGV